MQLLRCVTSGVMTAIPKRIALRYPGDFDVIADKTRVTMVTGVGATTIARITRVQWILSVLFISILDYLNADVWMAIASKTKGASERLTLAKIKKLVSQCALVFTFFFLYTQRGLLWAQVFKTHGPWFSILFSIFHIFILAVKSGLRTGNLINRSLIS